MLYLAADIAQTLEQLASDPFHSSLETHKLKGAFTGVWSCSAGYDLRILFEFVKHEPEDDLLLINIGTHDDVYSPQTVTATLEMIADGGVELALGSRTRGVHHGHAQHPLQQIRVVPG